MNFGGNPTAIAVVISIDVLMGLSLYLPIVTGALYIVPIGSMGLGAYIAGKLALHGSPSVAAILAAAGAGAGLCFAGGTIVARMRPWSGAIASFAMVEVIQVIFEHASVIGGANGLLGIPLFTSATATYAVTAAAVVLLLVVDLSPVGDVLEAIRSDELAAESAGLRIVRIRLLAFAAGGALAGIAGATSAGFLGFVDPGTYGLVQLNSYLIGTILGGSTTALGSLFGGVVVNIVPQVLAAAANYTLVASSAVVILIILVRREGLITRRFLKRALRRVRQARRARSVPALRVGRRNLPRHLARRPQYTLLRASAMSRAFGGARVVRSVDVELRSGEVLGVIGANGAGKTTLVNLITGVIRRDEGEVAVSCGDAQLRPRRLHPQTAVRMGIARTFQAGRLFRGLDTREHVSLLRGSPADELLATVGLSERATSDAASLPYGDQRLLEIARALATQPRFLILDEPCAGMTGQEMEKVAELVRRLKEQGLGIMIVDHNVDFIAGLSDRMMAMDFGEVIAAGPPNEVLRDPRVVRAYLGEETADVSQPVEMRLAAEPAAGATRRIHDNQAVAFAPEEKRQNGGVVVRDTGTAVAGDGETGTLLRVQNAVVRYGPVTAVRGVGIDLRAGEARAVIGSNGAGKTSLLRAICGLVPLAEGRVELGGVDITTARPEERAKRGIALVPEGRGVFGSMSVADNILVAGGRSRDLKTRMDELFEMFPLLAELRNRRAGLLSGGEQQVLAVARALMTRPRVVLLDEPSMGLSPIAVKALIEALENLGATGPALLLVEQNARLAFQLAEHVYAMQNGTITLEGSFTDLMADDALRQIYLGPDKGKAGATT